VSPATPVPSFPAAGWATPCDAERETSPATEHDRACLTEGADDEHVAGPLDEPEDEVSLRDQLGPRRAIGRGTDRDPDEPASRRAFRADRDVAVAVEDAVARAVDAEQERTPRAVRKLADEVRARLDLARDRDEPPPVGRDLRVDAVRLAHLDRLGHGRLGLAEAVDEDDLVDALEVGRRPRVDGERELVGEPRDGGVGGERDPVGQHRAGLGLDHVEHALLVAAERQAVGDARSQGRREEPVERGVTRVDEHPSRAGRGTGDDERARVDPEPAVPSALRRGHGQPGQVRRDSGTKIGEPAPLAKRGIGEVVLMRLPGERLGGVELERAERVVFWRQ
jgi:hypothetical protein